MEKYLRETGLNEISEIKTITVNSNNGKTKAREFEACNARLLESSLVKYLQGMGWSPSGVSDGASARSEAELQQGLGLRLSSGKGIRCAWAHTRRKKRF